MRKLVTATSLSCLAIIICLAAFAGELRADDSIRVFTLQTLDGKTIRSETLKGMPLVINIGSHW